MSYSKFLTLPAKTFLGILIVTSVLLYGPASVLENLELYDMAVESRTFIGLLFLSSTGFLMAHFIQYIYGVLKFYIVKKDKDV
ncbi:MAG: super-infection exclusion protein B [Bacillota bacterium]|nr:super-infection exclusion protein B [Bacillota bacterium]MDW7682871.1 super-infection exclusion protein B [Bacillota bacterium]